MTHLRLTALLFVSSLALSQGRESSVFSDLPDDDTTFSLITSYNTRYWNDGRDYLENDDTTMSQISYTWESLTLGVWHAKSTELTYEESQIGLAWQHDLSENLRMYLGYAFIDYNDDKDAVENKSTENEFAFGLAYTGCPWGIDYGLDVYYSDDTDGFFGEVSAFREWELTEKLSTSLTGIVGMNQGYIESGSDGFNHMALIVGFSYEINECLTFGIEGIQSWGLDRTDPGDIDTDDFLHARGTLEWTF